MLHYVARLVYACPTFRTWEAMRGPRDGDRLTESPPRADDLAPGCLGVVREVEEGGGAVTVIGGPYSLPVLLHLGIEPPVRTH